MQQSTAAPGAGHIAPDERKLSRIQAKRLSAVAGVPLDTVTDRSVREIADRTKFLFDPFLLGFRRICGKVVKTDPVTGVQYPVPYATVQVEDTDSHFWSYAPFGSAWAWLWPFRTTREVIATTTTDRCGHFCVWVPRFEIDWILRWRRLHLCYDIFYKPTLRDILGELHVEQPIPQRPFPEPDPGPLRLDPARLLRYPHPDLSPAVTRTLAAAVGQREFGASLAASEALLDRPAFAAAIKPSLPKELSRLIAAEDHAAISKTHGFAIDESKRLSANAFVGPFRRCIDVAMPVWQRIVDVPDITFRVTQDVDGDGDQETIYSEGYFDVRWNAGAIPDVTLEARSIAIAGSTCDHPPVVCADVPAIRFAGLMPLAGPPAPAVPFHDAVAGFARRPNRTKLAGGTRGPGAAPYAGEMQLFGCVETAGAAFYRILREEVGSGVAVPMTEQWYIHRTDGTSALQMPVDANGWYPVRRAADGWDDLSRLIVMNWRTGAYADGKHRLVLQCADGGRNPIAPSADPVVFHLYNTPPDGGILELRWRVAGTGAWSAPLPRICPTIARPAGAAIEFQAVVAATSPQLRSVNFSAGGCGAADVPLLDAAYAPAVPVRRIGNSAVEFWFDDLTDTGWSETLKFNLSASAPQGAYHFDFWAYARSFNPSGDSGGVAADWFIDRDVVWKYDQMTVAIIG